MFLYVLNWLSFTLNFPFLSCHTAVLIIWLGLGTKTTCLGLFVFYFRFWHLWLLLMWQFGELTVGGTRGEGEDIQQGTTFQFISVLFQRLTCPSKRKKKKGNTGQIKMFTTGGHGAHTAESPESTKDKFLKAALRKLEIKHLQLWFYFFFFFFFFFKVWQTKYSCTQCCSVRN